MSVELSPHITGDWWDGISLITYKVNGVPVDITNASIKMHVKKDRKPASPIVDSWTTETNTITILNAAAGQFGVVGRLINWPAGTYMSDIEVIIDGKPRTIVPEIIWVIVQDITK